MDAASASASNSTPPPRKGRGRRKIEIKKIASQRRRWVAFSKRKKGLLRKAAHLSELSGEQIGVVIISEQGRVYSSDNADVVLRRYQQSVKDNGEDNHAKEQEDGFLQKQAVDVEKINDGEVSLQEIKQIGEDLVDLEKNVVARMEEITCKNYLFDLNKTPDEQSS